MISPERRALLKDAYYQVMDNWVFRILAVICLVFIMIPFVIGIREEGIVIGFGLYQWDYADIFSRFGGAGNTAFQAGDMRQRAIDFYMEFVVQKGAGNMGVLFSIAATSFFVPQMLEKGAADVLFHKPLSRLSFYLSRYFAGILFVTLLSSVLALGNYFGFMVASGLNDPGILMGAPMMIYVFSVVYSIAMLLGVLTRSTVASILLTCIFFLLNGCLDTAWKGLTELELQANRSGARAVAEAMKGDSEAQKEDGTPILDMLWNTVCGIHYVMPKTGDADVLASKLRRTIGAPPFREDISRLALKHIPEGYELMPAADGRAAPEMGPKELALLGDARLYLRSTGGEPVIRITLFRRAVELNKRERKGRTITSRENSSKASGKLEEAILMRLGPVDESAAGDESPAPRVLRDNKNFNTRGMSSIAGYLLTWRTAQEQMRQAHVFRVGQDWIYTLLIDDSMSAPDEERTEKTLATMGLELGYDDSVPAYEEAFTLSAPWRYNILFSVASTLAFTLLMLFLGYWKLRRIDF